MLASGAKRLYIAAVILLIVPIWCVRHLPTVDGPSHVYNAEIIRHIVRGDHCPLTQWFRINRRPVPNWSGHLVLALLLTLFPAAIAEKLLMTGIIALFMTGVWMYAGCDDERRHVYAFVAIPLAYNQLFQLGFYNYAIGVGLSLVTIAWWWRHRAEPTLKSIAITSLLLVACYFSHPLTTALTIASLLLLWLAQARLRRESALHLLMLLPVAPFLGWYAFSQPDGSSSLFTPMPFSIGWSYLSKTQLLLTFDPRQLIFGRVYFALFVVLFIVTFIRQSLKREASLFLVLTLIYLVLYYALSSNANGGSFIHERLALAFMLAPLAWFTPRVPSRALIAAFLCVAVAEAAFLVKNYTHADHNTTRLLASTRGLGARSTLVPLLGAYDARPGSALVPMMKAINYAAIDHELVNLDNYEAGTDYFPITFAPSMQPNVFQIENQAWTIDAARYAPEAEWVFTWKFGDETQLAKDELPRGYALIAANGNGRVYRSKVISP